MSLRCGQHAFWGFLLCFYADRVSIFAGLDAHENGNVDAKDGQGGTCAYPRRTLSAVTSGLAYDLTLLRFRRRTQLVEEMIRTHLGWLVVWGNLFGGLIGKLGLCTPRSMLSLPVLTVCFFELAAVEFRLQLIEAGVVLQV